MTIQFGVLPFTFWVGVDQIETLINEAAHRDPGFVDKLDKTIFTCVPRGSWLYVSIPHKKLNAARANISKLWGTLPDDTKLAFQASYLQQAVMYMRRIIQTLTALGIDTAEATAALGGPINNVLKSLPRPLVRLDCDDSE